MGKTIKYFKVNKLTDKDFRRIVGVKRDTFKDMETTAQYNPTKQPI